MDERVKLSPKLKKRHVHGLQTRFLTYVFFIVALCNCNQKLKSLYMFLSWFTR